MSNTLALISPGTAYLLRARLTIVTALAGLLPLLLCSCNAVNPLTVQNEEAAWQSARQSAASLLQAKRYKEAEKQAQLALHYATDLQSVSPLHLADSDKQIADVYLAEGDSASAQSYYEKAVRQFEAVSSSKVSSEMYKRMGVLMHAQALVALGDIQAAQSHFQQADDLYKQALKAKGSGIGCTPVSIDVARARLSIGDRLRASGDYQSAYRYYQAALHTNGLVDITAAQTRADIGRCIMLTADAWRDKGNYSQSENLYTVSMSVAKGAESRPLVEEIKQHYAVFARQSGRQDDPQTFAQRTPEVDLF